MRRSTDEPRHPVDKTAAQDQRLTELARAQGRGTTALRDGSGNTLVMNPNAPYPLLRPEGVDASVAFDPTTNEVKMVSPDTNEDRDMTVRDISSSGNVYANNLNATGNMQANTFSASGSMYANGDMFAQNFRADGQTTANNLGANSGNFGTLTAGPTQVGALTCNVINASGDILAPGRNISTDFNGVMHSALYVGGTFQGHGVFDNSTTISDRRLKSDFSDFDHADLDKFAAAPVQQWRWASDTGAESRQHIGPVAQDMPAVAAVEENDGRLGIDQTTYLGLLLALCQRQQTQIDALTASLAAITARLDTP